MSEQDVHHFLWGVAIALAAWHARTALRFVPGLPRQVARYAFWFVVFALLALSRPYP